MWDLEPLLHFVTAGALRAAEQEEFRRWTPEKRLARQNYDVFDALRRFATSVHEFAVTGAAAAVLQGVHLPVEVLEVVVLDDDATLEALIWQADAVITLVPELPPTLPMSLDDTAIVVVGLAELATSDPRVADALGAAPPSA